MRKTILIAGVAICVICAALISYGIFTQRDVIPPEDLTLSDYPELFAKETVIVIGENATQIEKESAEAIAANLENLTGNKPKIYISKKIESLKYLSNLIILGTPKSNEVIREVYNMTDATRVTEEYPGENKGILEILRNPWNEDKATLLVEGSDEWGVKAGSEMLGQLQDINKDSVITEWNGVSAVVSISIPVDKYSFIEIWEDITPEVPIAVDRPIVYLFNESSGILEGGRFAITNDLIMVVGKNVEVKEPGSGGAGGLIPIYSIPSSVKTFRKPYKIVYLETDGTIQLIYDKTKVVLKPGEKWERKYTTEWMGHKVRCETIIENHGLQDKNKIMERRLK